MAEGRGEQKAGTRREKPSPFSMLATILEKTDPASMGSSMLLDARSRT